MRKKRKRKREESPTPLHNFKKLYILNFEILKMKNYGPDETERPPRKRKLNRPRQVLVEDFVAARGPEMASLFEGMEISNPEILEILYFFKFSFHENWKESWGSSSRATSAAVPSLISVVLKLCSSMNHR